jgi:hypothetical protein
MKNVIVFALLLFVLFSLTACAAGPNEMVNSENPEGNVAGFWQGMWHGFIALFTFLVSLFSENVGVYEAHNNGGWYNFGFILGVMVFFGGSGSKGRKGLLK